MKDYKIFHSQTDNPLIISREMYDNVINGLDSKMGKYFKFVIPPYDIMSDVHFYKLFYLDTALNNIRNCKGYDKHIAEYQNNAQSTFFVSVVADILVGHGLLIELEPDILDCNGKPDLYAQQKIGGLGVYFECKQPKEDTQQFMAEQRRIFDGIEGAISDEYSLALFYNRELQDSEISHLHNLIQDSFKKNENVFENRVLVDNSELGAKVIISGISDNIERGGIIESVGIPNFSDNKGYSNCNGINRYGKNIVFYKAASRNAISSQLKNSTKKVPDGSPYVVCIDLSGPRFDVTKSSLEISNHFSRGDYSNLSGVILVNHGIIEDGKYHVQLDYIENQKSKVPLPFLKEFFYKSLMVDFKSRQFKSI